MQFPSFAQLATAEIRILKQAVCAADRVTHCPAWCFAAQPLPEFLGLLQGNIDRWVYWRGMWISRPILFTIIHILLWRVLKSGRVISAQVASTSCDPQIPLYLELFLLILVMVICYMVKSMVTLEESLLSLPSVSIKDFPQWGRF